MGAEATQAPVVVRAGQWIWTREWQGPYLEVRSVTPTRITCIDHGRKCFIAPDKVVCAGATKEAVSAAAAQAVEVHNRRLPELQVERELARAAKQRVYDLERAIRAEADDAARAHLTATTPSVGGVGR